MVARKGDAGGKRQRVGRGRERERERERERDRGVDPLKATGREEGEKERRTEEKDKSLMSSGDMMIITM